MEHEQQLESFHISPPQPLNNRILLLDSNAESRDSRAAALRLRGALVDCAGDSGDARSLWKPGSHQLVLIDFRGADSGIHDFYAYARAASAGQRFAFYVAKPRYVTTSPAQGESAYQEEAPAAGSDYRQSLASAEAGCFRVGLTEAAKRIATIRRLTHSRVANATVVREDPRGSAVSSSDAIKIAERVLSGS